MADTLKILGQSNPGAQTLTDLYYPASGSAAVSSIVVCNTGNQTATFRISVAQNAAADTRAQYLYYELPITGYNTFVATIGISLATNDTIRIYASNISLVFSVFGVEIS